MSTRLIKTNAWQSAVTKSGGKMVENRTIHIGVLAMQGAFIEHVARLDRLKIPNVRVVPRLVKTQEDLKGLGGLILPGGESTAMAKLLHAFDLMKPIQAAIEKGLPVWGTCAGMILLAKQIEGEETSHLRQMDIAVKRNAFGRQIASFVHEEALEGLGDAPVPMVFIRAPYAVSWGSQVKVLSRVNDYAVALRQGHMLATAFHPELTDDLTFHTYFVNMAIDNHLLA